MKGDFTRITFDPSKHYTRVLSQQGRLQLDADPNEQSAIIIDWLRNLTADLIGPYAGPHLNCGFELIVGVDEWLKQQTSMTEKDKAQFIANMKSNDFVVGGGHYYVGGMLCINDAVLYSKQPFLADADPANINGGNLLYLDVWERHITSIQDSSIRDAALNGADTSTRTQLVWQIRVLPVNKADADIQGIHDAWPAIVQETLKLGTPGLLLVGTNTLPNTDSMDACTLPPDSLYRGNENQLYRFEIHSIIHGNEGDKAKATVKFSRNNGSLAYPIAAGGIGKQDQDNLVQIQLAVPLREHGSSTGWKGCWVEISWDEQEYSNNTLPLYQVVDEPDFPNSTVSIKVPGTANIPGGTHPLLRRWDHPGDPAADGAVLITQGSPIPVEDGIYIEFPAPPQGQTYTYTYQPGDYWVVPARVRTGTVEWPLNPDGTPKALPPQGVQHYYAPLALVTGVGPFKFTPMRYRIGQNGAPYDKDV